MAVKTLAVLREGLGDHPAVRAWRAVAGGSDAAPTQVDVLRRGKKSQVYRLHGVGDGGAAVIAKRSGPRDAEVERTVYAEILPLLPLTSPRLYGAGDGGDGSRWLLLEDVGSTRYSELDPAQHAMAGRWLAALHASALRVQAARRSAERLPSAGPDRYRAHLRAGREALERACSLPQIEPAEVRMMRALVALEERIDARWHVVEEMCEGLPSTLVHGDFQPKNVLVRTGSEGTSILPIDWEDAGFGPPAADLVRVDLAAYCQALGDSPWNTGFEAIRRLAILGAIWRSLAAIAWDSVRFAFEERINLIRPLSALPSYHARLSAAAAAAGV